MSSNSKLELESNSKTEFQWAVPEELKIPPDTLRLRINFFHQATEIISFEGDSIVRNMVSAYDIAQTLANELSFISGLLPDNTLWWRNSRSGPVTAVFDPPKVRTLALQFDPAKPAKRFTIPLPGLVFICRPGSPPWVYALKAKPKTVKELVYRAPLFNIYDNGRSCPGSSKYPNNTMDIIENFWLSFFTSEADSGSRSMKFPKNLIRLWESLIDKNEFPVDDLIPQYDVTVQNLMEMEM